jgi:hypothetical protein
MADVEDYHTISWSSEIAMNFPFFQTALIDRDVISADFSAHVLTSRVVAEQGVAEPIPEGGSGSSEKEEDASSSGSDATDHLQERVATSEALPSGSGPRLAQELGDADRELLESIRSRGEVSQPIKQLKALLPRLRIVREGVGRNQAGALLVVSTRKKGRVLPQDSLVYGYVYDPVWMVTDRCSKKQVNLLGGVQPEI